MKTTLLLSCLLFTLSCASKNLSTSGLDYKPAAYGPQLDERGLRQNFLDRGR